MREIKLEYQHGRLVFKLGEESYFINSDEILKLLDRQRIRETFHSLNPAVIYSSWENLDFVATITALQEKGLSLEEVAGFVWTTTEQLKFWIKTRANVIERIKSVNPSNFKAAVRGLKERLAVKRSLK